jgi:hypothetical protein
MTGELWSCVVPHADLGLGPMEVALRVMAEDIRPTMAPGTPFVFAKLIEKCWVSSGYARLHVPWLLVVFRTNCAARDQATNPGDRPSFSGASSIVNELEGISLHVIDNPAQSRR